MSFLEKIIDRIAEKAAAQAAKAVCEHLNNRTDNTLAILAQQYTQEEKLNAMMVILQDFKTELDTELAVIQFMESSLDAPADVPADVPVLDVKED